MKKHNRKAMTIGIASISGATLLALVAVGIDAMSSSTTTPAQDYQFSYLRDKCMTGTRNYDKRLVDVDAQSKQIVAQDKAELDAIKSSMAQNTAISNANYEVLASAPVLVQLFDRVSNYQLSRRGSPS